MTRKMEEVWKLIEEEIRRETENLEKRENEFTFGEFMERFNLTRPRAKTLLNNMIQKGFIRVRKTKNRSFYFMEDMDTKP